VFDFSVWVFDCRLFGGFGVYLLVSALNVAVDVVLLLCRLWVICVFLFVWLRYYIVRMFGFCLVCLRVMLIVLRFYISF